MESKVQEKPKKKRGRKPKSIINTNKLNDNKEKKNDNMIIKLKVDKNNNNDILPGYSEDYNNVDEFSHNKTFNCWNCCHKILKMYSIPLKYNNNKFYVYGDFCCLGCSLRYITDTFKNRELWEKYELFNLYNRKIYGKYIDVKLPPNKLCLEYFGGNMKIEDYRDTNFFNEMNNPIIIPVKHNGIKKENTLNIKDKGNLKLYRKSKNEKNIVNNMNI